MEQSPMTRILAVAIAIAEDAPKKKGAYVFRAGIRWTLIDDLRRALDDAGVKWEV